MNFHTERRRLLPGVWQGGQGRQAGLLPGVLLEAGEGDHVVPPEEGAGPEQDGAEEGAGQDRHQELRDDDQVLRGPLLPPLRLQQTLWRRAAGMQEALRYLQGM